jgi:hypothetical protein
MPKSMQPPVKLEDGEVEGQGAEGAQEEAGALRAVQRRRGGGAGDADQVAVQLLRLNMEVQAQAIQGLERARVLGEELLQAKLEAEVKMREDALQAK